MMTTTEVEQREQKKKRKKTHNGDGRQHTRHSAPFDTGTSACVGASGARRVYIHAHRVYIHNTREGGYDTICLDQVKEVYS